MPHLVVEMNARLAARQAEPPEPERMTLARLQEIADAEGWDA